MAKKTYTSNDVADMLGVAVRTAQKRIKELFPKKSVQGTATYLTSDDMKALKKAFGGRR